MCKVDNWYLIVCIPDFSSSNILSSANSCAISKLYFSLYFSKYLLYETLKNGAICFIVIEFPPYCPLAICAIICVVTVHAVANDFGDSTNLLFITVPLVNISSKFINIQLCIGCIA